MPAHSYSLSRPGRDGPCVRELTGQRLAKDKRSHSAEPDRHRRVLARRHFVQLIARAAFTVRSAAREITRCTLTRTVGSRALSLSCARQICSAVRPFTFESV